MSLIRIIINNLDKNICNNYVKLRNTFKIFCQIELKSYFLLSFGMNFAIADILIEKNNQVKHK